MFVIKRLSDAVAENDNIHGVIRGVEVNQSGLAHSITHPHSPTQESLFRQLLDKTGVNPLRVSVVEAHGTEMQAGDRSEFESVCRVFGQGRSKRNPLYVTSIKANIGHLGAASGAAGLAKILTMFKQRRIPRQLSLHTINPSIAPMMLDGIVIPTEETTWETQDRTTRMAILNNFGAAGSNSTALIEEFPRRHACTAEQALPVVFGLSAKTENALMVLQAKYLHWLKQPATLDLRLPDLAYTVTARRQLYEFRMSTSADNLVELCQKLAQAKVVHVSHPPAVVFVFSGQGGQYLGMGRVLYQSCPLFKQHVDDCHLFLVASGFPGVLSILATSEEASGLKQWEEFEAFQSALFTLQYALASLWISWGVTPSVVIGHR